jgi:hypothetical protein
MFRHQLLPEVKEALAFYLRQYLDFLNAAGHNCILNLPDFDDDEYALMIDYSLTTKAIVRLHLYDDRMPTLTDA